MLLTNYQDFISRVEELGFLPFSGIADGMPSLASETPGNIWHTGDDQTDPWRWKDRACEEKRLAFGCLLGGNKGFIAPRLYPAFLTACRPEESMEERYSDGLVSQTVWELWKLFQDRRTLDTSEIRRLMGVTRKKGSSRVDSAAAELQKHFCITVAGSRQKLDRSGQPYGWRINVYELVEDWVPDEWLTVNAFSDREEAQAAILDIGQAMGSGIDRNKLAKALGFIRR
jgi:hypothetical protein